MTAALIISTYNRPDALRLCLESVCGQNVKPQEVIIADDGSTALTKEVIKEFENRLGSRLLHVWHPDNGFQLGKIRNKAVAASISDYIIQVDGDVVLHPEFVRDHIAVAKPGFYVKGSRVRLGDRLTKRLETSGKPQRIHFWTKGVLKDREKAVYLGKLGIQLSAIYKKNSGTAIGCNMAFWRNDFIAINGYDENFVGWGCEDTDICMRFEAMGLQNFKLFRCGIVYHLWHVESDKSCYSKSLEYFESKDKNHFKCDKGINQYIDGN